jgi:LPXTG-motif cell wall-anchored protein
MYKVPGSGVAVGTGVGSLAATGAGVTWWIVAAVVLLLVGVFLLHATRKRRGVTGDLLAESSRRAPETQ